MPAITEIQSEKEGNLVVSRDIQRLLWTEVQESLKRRFEQQLFGYIQETIEKDFPSYCSGDGKLVDRRLAKRIGVDPALICRLRGEDAGALNRFAHFLALMNLCGVEWDEVGFPSPQVAVIDAMIDLFPIAERALGVTENEKPSREEILLLYFAKNSAVWKSSYDRRSSAQEPFEVECEKIFILVACADSGADDSSGPLVAEQKIEDHRALEELVNQRWAIWSVFHETFPFLGKPLDKKAESGWGIF